MFEWVLNAPLKNVMCLSGTYKSSNIQSGPKRPKNLVFNFLFEQFYISLIWNETNQNESSYCFQISLTNLVPNDILVFHPKFQQPIRLQDPLISNAPSCKLIYASFMSFCIQAELKIGKNKLINDQCSP